MMEAIIIFVLIAAFIALSVDYYKVYKEKEKYRCRVFELTNGKEGSNLPKAPDIPAPPRKMLVAQPFINEWLKSGKYIFRKSEVKAFYKNCGGKYVLVFKGVGSVETDITNEDDVKLLLGIGYVADIKEELKRKKLPEYPEKKITKQFEDGLDKGFKD